MTHIIMFAVAATGLAALVRTAPWKAAWKAQKPLSCAVCMGGHASWLVMLAAFLAGSWAPAGLWDAAITFFGSTGLAAFLLAQTGAFTGDLFAPHEE